MAAETLPEVNSFGLNIIESDEVKNNKVAHGKFIEITGLLDNINFNDALVGNPINRYCLLYAECRELENDIDGVKERKIILEQKLDKEEVTFFDYMNFLSSLEKAYFKYDNMLMSRREMMLKKS